MTLEQLRVVLVLVGFVGWMVAATRADRRGLVSTAARRALVRGLGFVLAVEGAAGVALWVVDARLVGAPPTPRRGGGPSDAQRYRALQTPDGRRVVAPDKWRAPPPAGSEVLRVSLVGDSFVASEAHRSLSWWLAQAADEAGREVEVANHGIHSADLATEAVLVRDLELARPPDLLVWVWILNDVGVSMDDGGDGELLDRRNGILDHLPDLVEDVPSHALRLVRFAQLARRADELTTEHHRAAWDDERNGPALAALQVRVDAAVAEAQAAGTRVVVAPFPLLHDLDAYPFHDAHRRMIRLAEDAGADVVDLMPVFAGRDASALWVTPEDHHPNAEANRLAIAHLWPTVADAEPGARCRPGVPVGDAGRDAFRAARCDEPVPCRAVVGLAGAYAAPGTLDPALPVAWDLAEGAVVGFRPDCFPTWVETAW